MSNKHVCHSQTRRLGMDFTGLVAAQWVDLLLLFVDLKMNGRPERRAGFGAFFPHAAYRTNKGLARAAPNPDIAAVRQLPRMPSLGVSSLD